MELEGIIGHILLFLKLKKQQQKEEPGHGHIFVSLWGHTIFLIKETGKGRHTVMVSAKLN